MADQSHLRDGRRNYHFWVDDAIFDVYGPQLGPFAGWVYCYLARRAKEGTAFPSLTRIARDTGISRRSVVDTIKHLENLGLITKATRTTTSGDHTSNLYTLLDMQDVQKGMSTPETLGSAAGALR